MYLSDLGAEMALPPITDPNLGYQFDYEGHTIEILGTDGVQRDPATLDNHTTIQVEGGSQALARSETVLVALGNSDPVPVRRPDLLGAILIKAREPSKRSARKPSACLQQPDSPVRLRHHELRSA